MVLSDYEYAKELTPEYASEKDGQAGTIETSRVMAIKPELVKETGRLFFLRCLDLKLLRILRFISQVESTEIQRQHPWTKG